MNTLTKILAASLILGIALPVSAQNIITANAEFRKNISFDFNSEWHYLTTDLYLCNAHQFSPMLADLFCSPKKKKKPDDIQNIFITAKIDGTSLSGITYPIYNFTVDNSQNDMRTYTAADYEAVTIIDNLPLSSVANGKIDAAITVDIITGSNSGLLYDFVADQLTNLSAFATPLSASKVLVGELGSLIKSKSRSQEYRFSSTVRLYEDTDFNKRICSVSVYVLMPSQADASGADFSSLGNYLDTEANPQLSRNSIRQMVSCPYPYIVAVNYKSKYVSEPVTGDEITSEYVESRNVKIRRNYDGGLISTEIYTQENRLTEYLTLFVELKNSINNYMLNSKNKTTDDFSKMFSTILADYRTLRRTMLQRDKEFATSSVYANEFKPVYQSIMRTAEIYLDYDNNTKNIKNIVRIMSEYGRNHNQNDSARNEQSLQYLHSITFASSSGVEELAELNSLITRIENRQFNSVFASRIEKLCKLEPSPQATQYCEKLKDDVNTTYCKKCRTEADSAIAVYTRRLDAANNRAATASLANSITQARDQIYYVLQREKTMGSYFSKQFTDSTPMSPDLKFLYDEYISLMQNRQKLQNTINADYNGAKTSVLETTADDITASAMQLQKQAEAICEKNPALCDQN